MQKRGKDCHNQNAIQDQSFIVTPHLSLLYEQLKWKHHREEEELYSKFNQGTVLEDCRYQEASTLLRIKQFARFISNQYGMVTFTKLDLFFYTAAIVVLFRKWVL